MIDRISLPVASDLKAALQLLAMEAAKAGNNSAADQALELAASLSGTVHFRVTAADLMAVACDEMRRQGEHEAVERLDELVRTLKRGPRRIVGAMNYHFESVSQLDDSLEKIRKGAIKAAGG